MLLILTLSIILMALCILLHYSQHFQCRWCKSGSFRLQDPTLSPHTKPHIASKTQLQTIDNNLTFCRFHWCCGIRTDAELDWFPLSYLLYMIYMLIISGLITFKYIYDETATFNMYYHNDKSYNVSHIFNIENSALLHKTATNISSVVLVSYLDWIIYILIIFANIWESLFSFYRYYTTIISAKYCCSLSFMDVLKHFVIYMVTYILLFTIQTQIYYFIFPLILIFYLIINIYWISKSSDIIIESVERINGMSENINTNQLQNDLVYSVRLMRNISISSLISSCIQIGLFTIIYNIKIVYYFPFIWCLSMVFFVCNFIRNRQLIKRQLSLLFCHCCNCCSKQQNTVLFLLSNFSSQMPQAAPKLAKNQLHLRATESKINVVSGSVNMYAADTPNQSELSPRDFEKKENKFVVCIEYIDEEPEKEQKATDEFNKINTEQIQHNKQIASKIQINRSNLFSPDLNANMIESPVSLPVYCASDAINTSQKAEKHKSNSTGDLMILLKKGKQNKNKNKKEDTSQLTNTNINVNKNMNSSVTKTKMKTPQSVPIHIQNMISRSYQYIVNKKNKNIKTPQSMDVIDKQCKKLPLKTPSLKPFDSYDGSIFDMDTFDEDLSANNMSKSRRQSISKTPTSLYKKSMKHLKIKKPMSRLILPNLPNTTLPRSSSNPLLAPYISNQSNINNQTKGEDEKYDSFINLMTPSIPKTYSASNGSMNGSISNIPELEFDDISAVEMPPRSNNTLRVGIDIKHQKSKSGNDVSQLRHFTLFDALTRIQSETIYKSKSKKRHQGKNLSHLPKLNKSKHSQRKSVSVASIVNLIVSQGLYDKKSATEILQSNLTPV